MVEEEALAGVEMGDGGHVIVAERKIVDVQVLLHARLHKITNFPLH